MVDNQKTYVAIVWHAWKFSSEVMTPELLSTNTLKQIRLAMDLSMLSLMMWCTSCGPTMHWPGTMMFWIRCTMAIDGTVGCWANGFEHVLQMPYQGLFMFPLGVAGLGLRYFKINFLLRLGHPLRKPLQTALSKVEIFGLHSNWCANFTPLAQVQTECVNVARLMAGWISAVIHAETCGAQSTVGANPERVEHIFSVLSLVGKSVRNLQNSAINLIPDLFNSGIFIGILFFRS